MPRRPGGRATGCCARCSSTPRPGASAWPARWPAPTWSGAAPGGRPWPARRPPRRPRRGRPQPRRGVGRPRVPGPVRAGAGRVDYGHARADRPAAGTLTGYREGRQVAPVPDGSCDLTAHVAMDSLGARRAGRPAHRAAAARRQRGDAPARARHERPRGLPRRPLQRVGGHRADRPRRASATSAGPSRPSGRRPDGSVPGRRTPAGTGLVPVRSWARLGRRKPEGPLMTRPRHRAHRAQPAAGLARRGRRAHRAAHRLRLRRQPAVGRPGHGDRHPDGHRDRPARTSPGSPSASPPADVHSDVVGRSLRPRHDRRRDQQRRYAGGRPGPVDRPRHPRQHARARGRADPGRTPTRRTRTRTPARRSASRSRRSATFTYHHCVAVDQPMQSRSATLPELAAPPAERGRRAAEARRRRLGSPARENDPAC